MVLLLLAPISRTPCRYTRARLSAGSVFPRRCYATVTATDGAEDSSSLRHCTQRHGMFQIAVSAPVEWPMRFIALRPR